VGVEVTQVERRRRDLGLSQVDLAKAAKVTQQSISLIEGGRVPRLATAYAIAAALGTTLEDLFPQAAVPS
jgi:DNA-binding XRE family transcriptional regulator